MVDVIFTAPFKFSPNGILVIEYEAGPDPVSVSERCAEVAVAAGCAELVDAGETGETGAANAEPEGEVKTQDEAAETPQEESQDEAVEAPQEEPAKPAKGKGK